MNSYEIEDNSREFPLNNDFILIALCDKNNKINLTIDKEANALFQDKSNLYELIAETFEAGKYFIIDDFKCFVINKKGERLIK